MIFIIAVNVLAAFGNAYLWWQGGSSISAFATGASATMAVVLILHAAIR